jgi:hypothetical protein
VFAQSFAVVNANKVTVPPLFFNNTRLTIEPSWYCSSSMSGVTYALVISFNPLSLIS